MKVIITCLAGISLSALVAYGQVAGASSALPSQRAVLDQYCVTCHNERLKTAGLMLDKLDLAHAGENPEAWEKVVRKVRAGMMPPSGAPRPDRATLDALVAIAESVLDRAAAQLPNPGTTGLHRL